MYRDPILQGLIEEALRTTRTCASPRRASTRSAAQVGVAAADFYPQIGLGAAGSYGQQNAKNYVPGQGPSGAFNVNLGMSWELDIWGRVRNATDAAKAELMATEEFRRGVVLTLVADVAQTYAELMELDVELEVAKRNTVTRQGTLDLFTKRSQGGVGNDLEVNQARADLAVTAAAIPSTERLIALKESQMAVLLGRPPGPIPRAKAPDQQVAPGAPHGRAGPAPRAAPRHPAGPSTGSRRRRATWAWRSPTGCPSSRSRGSSASPGRRSRPPSTPRGSSGASARASSPPSSRAGGSPPRRRRPGPAWRRPSASTGSR